MGWFSGKTFGALVVGGPLLAQASVQHDAQKEQTAALRQMRDDDARMAAEAQTGAAVAANAQIAEDRRRRRASALGLGSNADDSLGGTPSALTAGASPASTAAFYSAAGPSYSGTALGAGAASATGPRASYGSAGSSRAPSLANLR